MCQAENELHLRYCKLCGGQRPVELKEQAKNVKRASDCPMCHSSTTAKDLFCRNCGLDLKQARKNVPNANDSTEMASIDQPTKNNANSSGFRLSNQTIALFVALAAIAIGVVVAVSSNSGTSKSDIEEKVAKCVVNKMVSYGVLESYARKICLEEYGLVKPAG